MRHESNGVPHVDRWGRGATPTTLRRIFEVAYRSWFRVEWDGLERVPAKGGALLVSNHAGMMPIDGGIIQYGIQQEADRLVYLLAHHGFFRYPFAGRMLNHFGTVVANPDNAHRLLREDGELVVVFPEGEKGPVKRKAERYRLQRFGRGGFVETAMRAGVPIVPIAVMGAEDTTPTIGTVELAGQPLPVSLNMLLFGPILGLVAYFPAKIRVRVLPPIHFNEAPELPAYPRSVLMDCAESIRGDIQVALDEMYEARGSKWFG